MSQFARRWIILAIAWAAALALTAATANAARKADIIWQHPDFARFGVQSIALLPIATYDHNVQTQGTVAAAWGQQFQGKGYRWMTTSTSVSMMRAAGGDSLLRVVGQSLLDQGRADSLQAPFLCARFHVQALLSLRVDRYEQVPIDPDQRGKPYTTVGLTAALVDSSGRLLWRGVGTETVEGLEHVPVEGQRTGEVQISSDADLRPPVFAEVLTRLMSRWSTQFPAPVATAAADSSHH
jgi:hypothetical protein